MGIADRDYVRADPSRRAGAGKVRLISVTAWLIIVNVAVFLLANVLLNQFLHATIRVSAGDNIYPTTTKLQLSHAQVMTDAKQVPEAPGIYYNPIVAPLIDPAGRPVGLTEIGQRRFLVQDPLSGWGHFSTGKVVFGGEVWRFLTFQFLHASPTHLLFNMLGLWFVGNLVEQYLGAKRYLAFYLLCGIFGGISYLLLSVLGYSVFQVMPSWKGQVPALLFDDMYTPLIGASAGVFGVLMAAAYIAPTALVDVLFVIPMRLRTAVYIFVGLAMLNLLRGGPNAGGDAAHIGGVAAGAYFIRHTHLLREFFDIFGNSRLKQRQEPRPGTISEIDRILDKVREEGLESLTAAERSTLRRASQQG